MSLELSREEWEDLYSSTIIDNILERKLERVRNSELEGADYDLSEEEWQERLEIALACLWNVREIIADL